MSTSNITSPLRLIASLLVLLLACYGPAPTPSSDAGAPTPAKTVETTLAAPIPPPAWTAASRAYPNARRGRVQDAGAPPVKPPAKPPDPRIVACTKTATDKASLMACLELLKQPAPALAPGKFGAVRPPPINPAWNTPDWYIKPDTGDDNNTCVSSGSPCKTFAEIVSRWGTRSPIHNTVVTRHWLTSQPTSATPADRVIENPVIEEGAAAIHRGEWTQIATGTFTGLIAKSMTDADGRLRATLGAPASGLLAQSGLFIVNSSRGNSVASINQVLSGTSVALSQPYVPNAPAPPTLPSNLDAPPAQDDTWSNGDTWLLMKEPAVYIGDFSPTSVRGDSVGNNTFGFVEHIFVPDPIAIGMSSSFFDQSVFISESWVDAFITFHPFAIAHGWTGFNSYFAGGGQFSGTILVGGAPLSAASTLSQAIFQNAGLDGDAIVPTQGMLVVGPSSIGGVNFQAGFGLVLPDGVCTINSSYTAHLYGSYTLDIGYSTAASGGAHFVYGNTGTATTFFRGVPTFLLDNTSVGYAIDHGFTPSPITSNVSITAAHIDGSIASGGFAGTVYGYGGSTIEPLNPATPTPTSYYLAGTGVSLSGGTPGNPLTISSTVTGGVSSVTGAGTVNCSPTTGNVTCTGTGAAAPACSQYQIIEHDNATGFQCGPAPGASGNFVESNGTSWVSASLQNPPNGGTGVSSPTPHAVPITEGSSPFNLVTAGAAGKLFQAQGVLSDPAWSPWTHDAPGAAGNFVRSDGANNWISSTIPQWFYAQGSGTAANPCDSTLFAARTITVPTGGATLEMTATLTALSPGTVCSLNWGIAVDNTACSFSVSTNVSTGTNAGNSFGSALTYENSYAAGSHTFDIQAGASGGSGCATIAVNDAHLSVTMH